MKTMYENNNLIIFYTGYDETGGTYWRYNKQTQQMKKLKNVDEATEDAMWLEQKDGRLAQNSAE